MYLLRLLAGDAESWSTPFKHKGLTLAELRRFAGPDVTGQIPGNSMIEILTSTGGESGAGFCGGAVN